MQLAVPGAHNAINAAGAVAVLMTLGHGLADAAGAMEGFTGTVRRLELHGEARGVRVYDDYSHHPTEVRAALAALGLQTSVAEVHNPGGHTAGTVADLDPTGRVPVGATVTVQVWGPAPAPPKKKAGPGHGPGKPKGHGKKPTH